MTLRPEDWPRLKEVFEGARALQGYSGIEGAEVTLGPSFIIKRGGVHGTAMSWIVS